MVMSTGAEWAAVIVPCTALGLVLGLALAVLQNYRCSAFTKAKAEKHNDLESGSTLSVDMFEGLNSVQTEEVLVALHSLIETENAAPHLTANTQILVDENTAVRGICSVPSNSEAEKYDDLESGSTLSVDMFEGLNSVLAEEPVAFCSQNDIADAAPNLPATTQILVDANTAEGDLHPDVGSLQCETTGRRQSMPYMKRVTATPYIDFDADATVPHISTLTEEHISVSVVSAADAMKDLTAESGQEEPSQFSTGAASAPAVVAPEAARESRSFQLTDELKAVSTERPSTFTLHRSHERCCSVARTPEGEGVGLAMVLLGDSLRVSALKASGAVAAWNATQRPRKQLLSGAAILTVNGISADASAMRDALKSGDRWDISFRPAPAQEEQSADSTDEELEPQCAPGK
jgi:hypothetical protein